MKVPFLKAGSPRILRQVFAPFLALALAFVGTTELTAQNTAAAQEEPVKTRLITDHKEVVPQSTIRVGVVFELSPGWHIYYRDPGDTGKPTSVELLEPQAGDQPALLWQEPEQFHDFGFSSKGFEGKTIIAFDVRVPEHLKPGDTFQIRVRADWLACKDECVPGDAVITLTLPVVTGPAAPNVLSQAEFEAAGFTVDAAPEAGSLTFMWALVLAFAGGMLLNLMPCVLPVLSLKIMGFVRQAGSGQNRKRILALGLAYTAGTLATFAALALTVVAMQAAGHTVGWGFQFQHPIFVVAMTTLVTVMALSLFGVFYMGISGGQAVNKLESQEGLLGAAGKGVSATLLSTPCTAPLLGAALGYAFTQPWWGILAIFLTAGLGMSAPYLLLCANPGWMKFLPKPGAWMETFKHSMGFLMLASAAWLIYILGRQGGGELVSGTVAFLVLVSFCTWTVGHFAGFDATKWRKRLVWLLVLVVSGTGFNYLVRPVLDSRSATASSITNIDGVVCEPYSQEALNRHLAAGKIVLVDFTADWCLTCKVNEAVLTSQTVQDKLREHGVVVLKADWTRPDPAITKALTAFGRSGVPLLVVYPGNGGPPVVLPELITASQVIDALDSAAKKN